MTLPKDDVWDSFAKNNDILMFVKTLLRISGHLENILSTGSKKDMWIIKERFM